MATLEPASCSTHWICRQEAQKVREHFLPRGRLLVPRTPHTQTLGSNRSSEQRTLAHLMQFFHEGVSTFACKFST